MNERAAMDGDESVEQIQPVGEEYVLKIELLKHRRTDDGEKVGTTMLEVDRTDVGEGRGVLTEGVKDCQLPVAITLFAMELGEPERVAVDADRKNGAEMAPAEGLDDGVSGDGLERNVELLVAGEHQAHEETERLVDGSGLGVGFDGHLSLSVQRADEERRADDVRQQFVES